MAFYEIDFTYDVEEFGTVTLEAASLEDAEIEAKDYVRETYRDVKNIQIDELKEIER